MNGPDRELVQRLVPHMRRLPGRLQALLGQIVRVRRAYEARNVSLPEYTENLETELDYLESSAREIALAAQLIRGMLDGPDLDGLFEVRRILEEAIDDTERHPE